MSDPMELALVFLAASLAVGFAFWIYLWREPPVRGRLVLAILRAVALLLLILLFWNPRVPRLSGGDDIRVPGVLLDASLSMTAAADSGVAPWEEGVGRAAELAGPGGQALLFGGAVRSAELDTLTDTTASDVASRLAPALERAASLGATSVDVVSDFRLEDPVAVARTLQTTGLGVRYVDVGRSIPNAGIAAVNGPASLPAGEEGTLEVLLAGETPTGDEGEGDPPPAPGADSVTLDLRVDDRLTASRRVPLPVSGRTSRHAFSFVAPEEEGAHRLRVRVTRSGDVFAADDEWMHHLEVEEGGAGLLILSLRADWEPRYLLPVLEQVTGLTGRGFLRLADEGWLSMGQGETRGGVVPEERVRALSADAEILVVQGLSGQSPAWLRDLAGEARRLIVFPADASAGPLLGLDLTDPRQGEWYVDSDVPASPLAGDLSGIDADGLPPLTGHLRLVTTLPSSREPLMVRRGRQGPLDPAFALVPDADRRSALILASGLWRWAARDGAPRESYRRLWAGISGWLLEAATEEVQATVRPARRPALRGEPVAWRVRGVGDTLDLRVLAGDSMVTDTSFHGPGSTIRTATLAPGTYRYEADAAELPEGGVEGDLEVTAHSDELLRPRVQPPGVSGDDGASRAGLGAGRPLRTHPAPYLLLILLLCAEWIGRRRQGLR